MRKVFDGWYLFVTVYGKEVCYRYADKKRAMKAFRYVRSGHFESELFYAESMLDGEKMRPVEETDPEWVLVTHKSQMCEYSSELMEDDDE